MEVIMVTIQMENGKEIKIELYPDVAPATVENFVNLVKDGFSISITIYLNGECFIRFIILNILWV